MQTSYLSFFLHKCTFWAQFFSTWKRVNCGKISQNFSKFPKISPKFPKISPHDNFFSTNIICDICDKYELCLKGMHYFEGAGVVQMRTCGRGKCHIGIRIIAWSEFFIETRRLDVMIEWVKGGAYPTIFSSSVHAPGGLCTTMAVGRSLSWRKLTKETKATTKSGKNLLSYFCI